MAGSFTSGRHRFVVEASAWEANSARGFCEDFSDDSFDLRVTDTGRVPDLGGAPFASWLLARLARLTDDRLGLAGVEDVDGGGYMIEFVAYRVGVDWRAEAARGQQFLFDPEEFLPPVGSGEPVASLQLQADMEGAAVIGRRSADCPAEEVLESLAAALLAAPPELMPRELAVRDPEWKLDAAMYRPQPSGGARNWYGWDGSRFLGRENFREAE